MITLALNDSPGGHLLRLVPSEGKKFWKILIDRGPWDEDERGKHAINGFKTTEPIKMGTKDLIQFSKETKRILREMPVEQQKLSLTFLENLPQFEISIGFITKNSAQYSTYYRPAMEGKFSFVPAINLRFSTFQSGREDDQYLYEAGGRHVGIVQYYSSEELLKFANDLEEAVKSKSAKLKNN